MKKKEELIMAVENATSRLKILIQKGIASNEPQTSIIARAVILINETTEELKKYTDDEDFILEQITGLNKLLNTWMNTYLLGLNKIAKINDSSLLKTILDNYKLLDKNNVPIKTLKNGGITIASLNDKDLVLAKEGITNIRDLMSNPVEGGVGRYVDYGKRLREEIAKLNETYAENPAAVSDSKGNKKNLRAMAEIKVRYDLISEDLKDKNAKYVMSTSHPNESERCHWWSAKLFKVDLDVETRRMYQYDKAQSQAMCKPLPKSEWVDGIPTYSLKTAVECGFLSYNCQHRLIKYYKGLKAPKYSLIEVEKKRNLTTYQRQLENRIRQTKLIETISGRNSEVLRKNPFTHEMEYMSASDYSKLLQEKYKKYCEDNGLVQYTWRLRITKEERGITSSSSNLSDILPEGSVEVEKPIETPTPKETTPQKAEFTKNEMDAVESYVSGDTMFINQFLRRKEALTPADKELVKTLDNAVSKEVVAEKKLYRSVDSSFVFGNLNENDYYNLEQYVIYGNDAFDKGAYSQSLLNRSKAILERALHKEVTDDGFLSTTKDKKVATEFQYFTGAEHPLVMELEIPKDDVHGFPVYKYFEVEEDPQKEILLERGLTMKITDISFISEEEVGTQLYIKAKITK